MKRFVPFRSLIFRLGFFLICLASLAQCFKDNTTQPFEIRVVNIKNGALIENAEITFVGQKLNTNSKGIASSQVDLDRFLLDRLVISVDASGFFSYNSNVLIGKDQQEPVIIKMTPENGLVYTPNAVEIFESEAQKFLEITNLGIDSIACKVTVLDSWIILDTNSFVVSAAQPFNLRIRTNPTNQSCKKTGRITINWRSNGKPDTVFIIKTFSDDSQPTAAFVLKPASNIIIQNTVFEVDASNSYDNCSPAVPLLYRWRFADGESYSGWDPTPIKTHVYPNSGAYTIKLQVQDGSANIGDAMVNVTVQLQPTPPVLDATMTAVDGAELLSATLTGRLLSFGQTYTSLLEYGFVWTTGTHDPTRESDNFVPVSLPAQTDFFSVLAQNLPPQKIRIRAYAHNGTFPREYSNIIELTPKVVDFRLINPNCIGSFTAQRGTNNSNAYSNEKPSSVVSLSCFFLSETEVTNEQYAAYMTSAQSGEAEIDLAASGIEKIGDKYRAKLGQGRFPMTHLTWKGARDFSLWLGGRLPTEAEWEAAARAGTMGQAWPEFSGTTNPEPVNHAVYDQPSALIVKSKLPNQWGIYDMSGNIEEWCNDFFATTHSPSTSNPQGPATGSQRVVRGGKFNDPKDQVTTTARHGGFPTERSSSRGFRVAKSL